MVTAVITILNSNVMTTAIMTIAVVDKDEPKCTIIIMTL